MVKEEIVFNNRNLPSDASDVEGSPSKLVGSEQALAPVRLPDTFAEGAWDKVPKTEGTFDFVFPTTIVHGFYKNYIGLFFVC